MTTSSADFETLARALSGLGTKLPGHIDRDISRWTLMGLARVKLAASGRPGPRRVTGDYTRSMNAQVSHGPGGAVGTIGTNAVQAARLEFGFYGADSRGRYYRQAPLPHWRPTFEWMQAGFTAGMPRNIDAAIREAFGA